MKHTHNIRCQTDILYHAQQAAATYNGTVDALITIARTETPGTLFRGISAVASGAGPAHAIYFSSYEQAKKVLGIADTAHENHIGACSFGALNTHALPTC